MSGLFAALKNGVPDAILIRILAIIRDCKPTYTVSNAIVIQSMQSVPSLPTSKTQKR